jgi:hypothetical protein
MSRLQCWLERRQAWGSAKHTSILERPEQPGDKLNPRKDCIEMAIHRAGGESE